MRNDYFWCNDSFLVKNELLWGVDYHDVYEKTLAECKEKLKVFSGVIGMFLQGVLKFKDTLEEEGWEQVGWRVGFAHGEVTVERDSEQAADD